MNTKTLVALSLAMATGVAAADDLVVSANADKNFVDSENALYLYKVDGGAKRTSVVLQWTDGTAAKLGKRVAVSDLVTLGLNADDAINIYNDAKDAFDAWEYLGTGWNPIPVYNVGGTAVEVAGAAADTKPAYGTKFWITRADTSKPCYFVGQFDKDGITVHAGTVDQPVLTTLTNFGTQPFNLSSLTEGCVVGDEIYDITPVCYYQADTDTHEIGWCEKKVESRGTGIINPKTKKEIFEDVEVYKLLETPVVPVGTTFRYASKGGTPTFVFE